MVKKNIAVWTHNCFIWYDIKNLSLFGFYVLNISRDWCLGHGTKIYEFPGTGNPNEKLLYYCLTNMLSKFCKKMSCDNYALSLEKSNVSFATTKFVTPRKGDLKRQLSRELIEWLFFPNIVQVHRWVSRATSFLSFPHKLSNFRTNWKQQ